MGGGNLNLASYRGSGDDIISVNPQITFFKKVFKRHTNFGIETKEISVSGSKTVDFGNRHTFVINKSGTLITDIHLEFTLPPAANEGGTDGTTLINCLDPTDSSTDLGSSSGAVKKWKNYVYWINNIGHSIVDTVELFIQNNLIDKQTGLWYDIWNELTDPNKKEWPLIGKRNDDYGGYFPQISNKKSRYYRMFNWSSSLE